MKKASSPTSRGVSKGSKRTNSAKIRKKDPFARPPHPLGFNFLSEERPIRAARFGSVIPSVMAKYGFGRRLGVERFAAAWRAALETVLAADEYDAYEPEFDDDTPSKLDTFLKYARPVSFRGGVLRVEIASNLLYQEMQFCIGGVLQELRRRLPEEDVRSIKLVVK